MYFAEAHIVLPDDAGVEGVEVQQQDEVLVEALHGLDDVSPLVLLAVGLIVLVILALPELVGDDQVPLQALVHD